MSHKALLIVLTTLVVIGGGVGVVVMTQPEQAINQSLVPKHSLTNSIAQEVPNKCALVISHDKQHLQVDCENQNTQVLSLADLPTRSTQAGNCFGSGEHPCDENELGALFGNKEFNSAIISPDSSTVAFYVNAAYFDWVGVWTLEGCMVNELNFYSSADDIFYFNIEQDNLVLKYIYGASSYGIPPEAKTYFIKRVNR